MNPFMFIIKINIESIIKYISINDNENNIKSIFLSHHYTNLNIKL